MCGSFTYIRLQKTSYRSFISSCEQIQSEIERTLFEILDGVPKSRSHDISLKSIFGNLLTYRVVLRDQSSTTSLHG